MSERADERAYGRGAANAADGADERHRTVHHEGGTPPPAPRDIADRSWMAAALEEARAARDLGEVPVGAVVVSGGRVVARAGNRTVTHADPTAHAEVLALRAAAARRGDWRLDGCTLYVTLEPCAMCAGAIVLSRVARVVFGAWDDKAGMAGSVGDLLRHPRLNHRPEVAAGVMVEECAALLSDFFEGRRAATTTSAVPPG